MPVRTKAPARPRFIASYDASNDGPARSTLRPRVAPTEYYEDPSEAETLIADRDDEEFTRLFTRASAPPVSSAASRQTRTSSTPPPRTSAVVPARSYAPPPRFAPQDSLPPMDGDEMPPPPRTKYDPYAPPRAPRELMPVGPMPPAAAITARVPAVAADAPWWRRHRVVLQAAAFVLGGCTVGVGVEVLVERRANQMAAVEAIAPTHASRSEPAAALPLPSTAAAPMGGMSVATTAAPVPTQCTGAASDPNAAPAAAPVAAAAPAEATAHTHARPHRDPAADPQAAVGVPAGSPATLAAAAIAAPPPAPPSRGAAAPAPPADDFAAAAEALSKAQEETTIP